MKLPEGYTELFPLGGGASGAVVAAREEATGHLLAVKQLSAALAGSESFLRRFRAEALTLRQLRHPNIAAFLWYQEAAGEALLAMELVNGVALRKLLDQGPTIPQAALVVLRGSLRGLDHAHRAGIVHRDYKPENVIVEASGTSRLIDFGIAVPLGGSSLLAGTPRYMAPEQWRGEAATPQTDVYASTGVFFECLTGRRPHAAETLTELRDQHLNSRVSVEDVPRSVRGLVSRGLAKDPGERYSSAGAFLEELEVAAVAGYGPDWAEAGTKALAAAALVLAVLFPLTRVQATASTGSTTGSTYLDERLDLSEFIGQAGRFGTASRLPPSGLPPPVLAASQAPPRDRRWPRLRPGRRLVRLIVAAVVLAMMAGASLLIYPRVHGARQAPVIPRTGARSQAPEPSPSAAAVQPSPPAVDSCLVGAWRSVRVELPTTVAYNGRVVASPTAVGGAGMHLTITTDGLVRFDLTGSQPLTAEWQGSTFVWQESGVTTWRVTAINGHLTITSSDASRTQIIVNGHSAVLGSPAPLPTTVEYSCEEGSLVMRNAGTTSWWVSVAPQRSRSY